MKIWHTKTRIFILDLVAAACLMFSAGTTAAAPLSPQQVQSLPLLMSWLEGHFDNSAQLVDEESGNIASAARHGRIDLIFKRVDLPQFGEFTFYSQQFSGGDSASVFRQAIYSIEPDEDGHRLNMTIHILSQAERFLNAHNDPSKLDQVSHDDVTTLQPQCVFRWEQRVDQFHGEIEKGACQIVSPRSGNKLTLLDEFYLADGELWFKDHGTDHEGNFAYGNIKGRPYKLKKQSDRPAEDDYSGTVFKRSNVLVSDLDRSLELFEGILGFTVSSRAKTIDGSYVYDLFQLPAAAELHFALLSAGPEQQRTIALVEVTNADIPKRTPPYTASMVLGVSDLTDKITAVSAMGLTTMRPNVGNGGGGSKLIEQAFVDFDGNVILLYEWLASAAAGNCEFCPEMKEVPAGRFMMGSTPAETQAEGMPERHAIVEWPQHLVQIDKPFLMGRYEVTRAEYRQFAEATGRVAAECLVYEGGGYQPAPGSGWHNPTFPQEDDHPVVCVDWEDANAYVDWLSEKTGEKYRLPSEAEWEYAARAGSHGDRYWNTANGDACAHANVADEGSPRPQFSCSDPYPETSAVDYGIANNFGLHGMLGNAGEWVADCGLPDYANANGSSAAVRDGNCENHVGRGGSWWNDAYYLRSARRYSFSGAYTIVGFRVARDL